MKRKRFGLMPPEATWEPTSADRDPPSSYGPMHPRARALGRPEDVRTWRCDCGALTASGPTCIRGHLAPFAVPLVNPFLHDPLTVRERRAMERAA
jgi:hypothetical protein